MEKIDYDKDHLSISQQISKLQQKKLIFHDKSYAYDTLQYIAYYRLSGYLHHFYIDSVKSAFIDNVYFHDVIKLYGFDKKLRLLILDAIETIEIALRSIITLNISQDNKFAFDNDTIFYMGAKNLDNFHDSRHTCWHRSKEPFVQHFNQKYVKPPVWVEVETWSMGTIRDYITSVKADYLNPISRRIGSIDNKRLVNWIRCFAHIRNISAHHSRLWNKNLMHIKLENRKYNFHPHMNTCNTHIKAYNRQHKTNIDVCRKVYVFGVGIGVRIYDCPVGVVFAHRGGNIKSGGKFAIYNNFLVFF